MVYCPFRESFRNPDLNNDLACVEWYVKMKRTLYRYGEKSIKVLISWV